MADLGRWLGEDYRAPGESASPSESGPNTDEVETD
jgi:endogenous inhibitor of DNA gyrase (YacG/DUF329 family)